MDNPFALPAFILAIISLIVATIGALTGIVALSWQIVTRRRGAHRVTVNVTNSVLVAEDEDDEGLLLIVEAINHGASAVRLTAWGFEKVDKGGGFMVARPLPISTPIPHMLEPGTNALFALPAAALGEQIRYNPGVTPLGLRAYVRLATGKTVYAKRRGIPMPDDFWKAA